MFFHSASYVNKKLFYTNLIKKVTNYKTCITFSYHDFIVDKNFGVLCGESRLCASVRAALLRK